MEFLLNFLVENYLWFLIISLILVFGLIGYIVDSNEKRTPKLHFQDDNEISTETIAVNETKSLREMLEENENDNILNVSDEKVEDYTSPAEIIQTNSQNETEELPKNE